MADEITTDPWWASKRVYAAVMMVMAMLAQLFGYSIDDATQSGAAEALTAIAAGVGAILAAWSKIKEAKNTKTA